MHKQLTLTAILVLALAAPAAWAEGEEKAAAAPEQGQVQNEDLSARDLVKKALDSVPDVPFTARVTLSSTRGWERQLELQQKKQGDVFANYMEVTAPHDVKDTRFLFYERTEGKDEQFIYVPALKRAVRIADETRKQPFLGSDFYVSDLVAPDIDDFSYAFVGAEQIDGRQTKLIESVPKNLEENLYSKTVSAVDPSDLMILRTQFFDKDGKLLKVWTITKLEKVDDHWTPLEQEMKNVQEETASTMKITEVKYNADVDDNIFNRSYLTR